MASCLLYKFPEDKSLRVAMASNKKVCVCVCCLEGNQGKQISIALTVTIGQGGRLKRALRAPGARRQHGPVNNFRIDS